MHRWFLSGIDHTPFEGLFELSDLQLREIGAVRRRATEEFGFPCRISLEDAPIGEELLLLPYEHHPAKSPYRASGPIFVRRGVRRRAPELAYFHATFAIARPFRPVSRAFASDAVPSNERLRMPCRIAASRNIA
jgi:hypothetical protein